MDSSNEKAIGVFLLLGKTLTRTLICVRSVRNITLLSLSKLQTIKMCQLLFQNDASFTITEYPQASALKTYRMLNYAWGVWCHSQSHTFILYQRFLFGRGGGRERERERDKRRCQELTLKLLKEGEKSLRMLVLTLSTALLNSTV